MSLKKEDGIILATHSDVQIYQWLKSLQTLLKGRKRGRPSKNIVTVIKGALNKKRV